jgi:hypothetical protein
MTWKGLKWMGMWSNFELLEESMQKEEIQVYVKRQKNKNRLYLDYHHWGFMHIIICLCKFRAETSFKSDEQISDSWSAFTKAVENIRIVGVHEGLLFVNIFFEAPKTICTLRELMMNQLGKWKNNRKQTQKEIYFAVSVVCVLFWVTII